MAECRVWLVYDLSGKNVLSSHDKQEKAWDKAREVAAQFVGRTIAVMAVEECFRGSVSVSKYYLPYAKDEPEAAPEKPALEIVKPEADGPTEF